MKEDLIYQLALRNASGVGPVLAKNLIAYSGGVQGIFRSTSGKLNKIPGVGEKTARTLLDHQLLKEAEVQSKEIEASGVDTIFFTDTHYPQRLLHCADAPILIFKKGQVDLNAAKVVSIVGTRNATKYGLQNVKELMAALSRLNVLVVSGLAYGVDICAHREAMANELPTLAVLAHGLDKIYPFIHSKYAREIIDKGGGLISEYDLGVKADRSFFPSRNRIVAGMADATIVIESGERGGSLITAYLAFDYNRDVFAYPGRITDAYSKGCNALIQKNVARLVSDPSDFLEQMSWQDKDDEDRPLIKQIQIPSDLTEEEQTIMELLRSHVSPLHINVLSLNAKISHSRLAAVLLSLEFKGLIAARPGNSYQIIV